MWALLWAVSCSQMEDVFCQMGSISRWLLKGRLWVELSFLLQSRSGSFKPSQTVLNQVLNVCRALCMQSTGEAIRGRRDSRGISLGGKRAWGRWPVSDRKMRLLSECYWSSGMEREYVFSFPHYAFSHCLLLHQYHKIGRLQRKQIRFSADFSPKSVIDLLAPGRSLLPASWHGGGHHVVGEFAFPLSLIKQPMSSWVLWGHVILTSSQSSSF